ncbi:MAG: electron transport complex subunit RsxB [Gallionellaceae bacterium]|nr:electron transport complex subunit RsxB [Gallionellaceae bacterium]
MNDNGNTSLVEKINALLPQTQCGKCGYSGCRPYAEAMAAGEAGINKCPPGGEEGIRDLAELLGVPFQPFEPDVVIKPPSVAFIAEDLCIGCTLCIQACPVDAIAGASKLMHTVIAALCTGCELCVPPCPVDCISMLPLSGSQPARSQKRAVAQAAKERYQFRQERLERDKREKAERLAQKEKAAVKAAAPQPNAQALIQAALERAKAQAAAVKPKNLEHLTPAQQAQIEEAEARRAKAREQAQQEKKPGKQ